MKEVLVKFTLPDNMAEEDLSVMLRDSLYNFIDVRCQGDAEAYAKIRFDQQHREYQKESGGKLWSVSHQNEIMSRILHYTRSRIEWARNLLAGRMQVVREVAVPQDDEQKSYNDAIRVLKEW